MNLMDLLPKSNNGGEKSGGGEKLRYRDYVIEAQEQGKEPLPFKEWYQLQNG